jgi:hypothetical protein
MKFVCLLLALPLVILTACSTAKPGKPLDDSATSPETVLITYHVKPGKEKALQETIALAWQAYRREHLVFAHPHLIVEDKENGDKTRLVEIFTWVSGNAPDHARDFASVKTAWDQMQSLCETRNGRRGLEISVVELIKP